MKNQKGFATIEIIFVVAIISTLTFIAVPKIEKVLDAIFLDYEMKKFCSELDLAASLNRSASFDPTIFENKISETKGEIFLEINNSDSYQLKKNGKDFREKHFLSFGIKINYSPESLKHISFDGEGKSSSSGKIILTSRLGKTAEIIFDSVGRRRGNKNVE